MTEDIKFIKAGIKSAKYFMSPFGARGLVDGYNIIVDNNFDYLKSIKVIKSEIKDWKSVKKHLTISDHVDPIIQGLTEVKSLIEQLLYPED